MRAAKSITKRMTWVIASLVLVISQISPVVFSTATARAQGGDVPSNLACTAAYGSPCITADKSDYSPTDTIVITGYGFVAGLGYNLAIQASTGNYNVTQSVTADGIGAISYSHTLDGVYRPNYSATVSDLAGNIIATTNFTDSRLITSATVGGAATTSVLGGATVAAVVNVSTNFEGSSSSDDWGSTSYTVGANAAVCVNHGNHSSAGAYNETFNITAPAAAGSYNVAFIAYSDSACSTGASAPLTLTNGIIVTSPITITSVTVDGSANPNVDPAKVVPVVVNATVAAGTTWKATEWQLDNGSWNCEDTTDKGTGTQNVTFNITAPIILGAHTLNVRAYTNNGCSSGQSPTFSLANKVNVTIVANPVLLDSCGLDISLVIDSSSSINSTELNQMKTAYVAFLNAFLPATSTQFSVTDFDTTAGVVQTFTANLATLTTAVNSPSSGGFTNWQDGLTKAQSTFDPRADKQNLMIFASDGNPNTTGGGPGGNASEAVAVNAAVGVANSIKASGTRIMALGIGNDLNVDNLKAISGPVAGSSVNSDVVTSDFATLAADLANLAKQLCGGTITAQKIIDADGNLQTTGDQTPASGWGFDIDGSPSNPAPNQTGADGYTPSPKVENGTYSITEATNSNYTLLSATCTGASNNGTLQGLSISGIAITTDQTVNCKFINSPKPATLIVKKVLSNDNGGSKTVTDFSYKINNGAAVVFNANGDNSQTVAPGTYSVVEVQANQGGYTTTYDGCTNVQIAIGETKTCIITNDDNAPALTLIKNVIKNNGGTAVASDWLLKADGPTTISGQGGTSSNATFKAGNYTLSESGGPSGYTPSAWVCTGSGNQNGSVISLSLGQSATCTITNDDDAAGLTLVKNLVDQYNSGAVKTNWTLTATGPSTVSGAGGASSSNVSTGSYTLGESGPTAGFDASTWDCGNANIVGTTLQIALGQQVTCTITNTAQPAKLVVKKVVTNNNGGSLKAENFSFKVNNGSSVAFEADGQNDFNNLPKGTYSVVEDQANQNGYATTYDGCTNVSISNGETKTCVITNDDKAPTLTLDKVLITDNGGSAKESDWLLKADGPTTISGQGGATSSADFKVGTYTLTESGGPAGYTASEWKCEGGELDGNQLTVALGDNVACEITNDDDAATLTLVKKLVDTYNLGAETTDWVLTATGPSVVSGNGGATNPSVTPGVYTLSELSNLWGFNDYSASDWSCTGGSLVENSLTIALGDSVNCEITNSTKGATIIVKKVVINDDNGTLTAGDFSANVGGDSQTFGEDPDAPGDPLKGQAVFYVPAGHSYTVTEDQEEDDNGYIAEYENNCDEFDSPELSISKYSDNWDEEDCFGDCSEMYVRVDETIVCTITNDDLGGGVGPNVDLSINKDDGGVVTTAGGSYDYTISVSNNGIFGTSNVVMQDVLPNSLKVNSITSGAWNCVVAGADVDGYGGTLTCSLPVLANGATADLITVNVTVKPGTTGVIVNTATVGCLQIDYNPGNNSDTETTPVQSIKVVKSGPANANAGDTVTYTFAVTNTGATTLSGITTIDTIAGAGVYQSGDTNTNGLLETGETWIYTANYKIPTGATDHVNNTVTACGTTMSQTQLPSIQLLRINSIAVPAPTTSAPVCDDDSHSLTINGVLVDTGNPIMASSVMAIVMLIIATYMALPRKRSLTSSK